MNALLAVLLVVVSAWSGPGHAEAPRVAVTILPLHSLVSLVMQGVGAPRLLVPGNASPHDYALRPSEARALREATLVFRIGPGLETFLTRSIRTLAADTRVVDLADADRVLVLAARRHEDWSAGSGTAQSTNGTGVTNKGHSHGTQDLHLWLSPDNAAALLATIRDELTAVDADNAPRYAGNTRQALERLAEHEQRWRARLAPFQSVAFVVFHDAYQYLERHFALNAVGAVSLSPERQPSAMHLRRLLERMRVTGARCLFREPQFNSALVDMLLAGSGANAGVLDPVGTGLVPGGDAWFQLMDANVDSLVRCLGRE